VTIVTVVTIKMGAGAVSKIPSQSSQPSQKGLDMRKNVQLPYDLFSALIRYHLMMDDDYEEEIRRGLEQKLDALMRHELYATYKTAPTEEEREKARQEYLDRQGVPDSFRW
jgi:hypothetical protein